MNNIITIILINIALFAIMIFWINLNFEKKNSQIINLQTNNELKIGEAKFKWDSTNKKLVLTINGNTNEWQ